LIAVQFNLHNNVVLLQVLLPWRVLVRS